MLGFGIISEVYSIGLIAHAPRVEWPAMSRAWPLTAVFLAGALTLAAACSDSTPSSAPSPSQAGERVREILANGDPLVRASELGALLSQLEPDALPAVRDAFDRAALDRGDTEVVLLATWWARFDPAGARDWTVREWTAAHISVPGRGPAVLGGE